MRGYRDIGRYAWTWRQTPLAKRLQQTRHPPHIVLSEREPDLQHAVGEVLLSLYQGKWGCLLAAWQVMCCVSFGRCKREESLLALSEEVLLDPGQVDRANPLPRALVGLHRERATKG